MRIGDGERDELVPMRPDDGTDADTSMKHADFSMYHAKDGGRDNREFSKRDMNLRALERRALENGLRCALERDELTLHCQPKINLETGDIVGSRPLSAGYIPSLGFRRENMND
jgi:predicted signal transduction protein with EAL and GGDEF domain